MGKVKNKDDVIQYTFRLNLTKEDHLEVHQTLQSLNKGVHKSQNNFIIDSVLRNIRNYTRDELLSDAAREQKDNEGFISKMDLEDMEQRVTDKVMKEVVTLLCSSLVGRTALPTIMHTAASEDRVAENQVCAEDDEVLSSLSNVWS